MTPQQIKTLCIARHLFTIASRELCSRSDIAQCSGISLLQDALESFVICLADFVNAGVKESAGFNIYLDKIDEKISPASLPFRQKLFRINRLRVNAKHHAIPPPADEINELLISAREFISQTCSTHLGVDFWTISFSDILDDGDVKNALIEAEEAFQSQNYSSTLLACRKVLYHLFEHDYDIKGFESDEQPGALLGAYSRAPFWTHNKEYIEKSVKEPTDYIVLDHQDLEHRLLVSGIDPISFWNVRRLTPDAYQRKDKTWVFKFDLNQIDHIEIQTRAEYALARTAEIVVAEHYARKNQQRVQSSQTILKLARECIPVYEKADQGNKQILLTPKGMDTLQGSHCTTGLKDDELYWSVFNLDKGQLFFGYILSKDVKEVTMAGQPEN